MQLPNKFVKNICPLLGDEWDSFCESLKQESPVSIRLNPKKLHNLQLPSPSSIAWCNTGYYLQKRPTFTFDPLFHAGAYYVQEASSMFIEQVFKQYVGNENVRVLDLCAAPGGKSTHIASLISDNSLLVSNEVIRTRANILSENITKAGYPNTIVVNNDPADISKLGQFFDVILVDAPCSGEGMFRKDPDALGEWSAANVQLCEERQQRIVADIWSALKPGGILIYSTCTYNRKENEDNVWWIRDTLGAEILPIDTLPDWRISPSYDADVDAYHFFPHKTKGEGFFLAAFRKADDDIETPKSGAKKNRKDKKQRTNTLSDEYKEYIQDADRFTFFDKNDIWYAFPSVGIEDFLTIQSSLRLVSAGICLGGFKGKDFIPDHSLALSTALNVSKFKTYNTDLHTAISYLRRETLSFPDLSKGYILLTYKNLPIGFVKNIGNRANNLYPNEWRIRTTHTPDTIIGIDNLSYSDL